MMETAPQVLGISYFGPVAGSPLVPPELVTIYFIAFIFVLAILYFILAQLRKPILLWHKIKLLVVIALVLKLFVLVGGSALAFYWFLPTPTIQKATPAADEKNFGLNRKFEIIFDRPVSRSLLTKSISPEVPGVWIFEDAVYRTHFYRKLTFHPTQTLMPNTTYTITLGNIRNTLKTTEPYSKIYSFTTQESPKVTTVVPANAASGVDINSPITVGLSQMNDNVSEFIFELNPAHPVTTKLDSTKKEYILTPTQPFKQGVTYSLVIKKTDVVYNIPTNTIVQRSDTTQEYKGSFVTKEAPGLTHFSPSGGSVLLSEPIEITFSQPMERAMVEKNFTITPAVAGIFFWKDDRTLKFTPRALAYESTYSVKIAKGTKAQGSGFLEEEIVKTFMTIGRVKVSQFSPVDGWTGVGIGNYIKVTFDQAVDKTSAQSKFTINPVVAGKFSWDGNTMIFTPSSPLAFSTRYTIGIDKGVKSINGLDSRTIFSASFTTQEQTVKLAVPVYLQQHALSCEIAALRMALAYRGHHLSEQTLLDQVGVDPTPHSGNVWGNPHSAFVGNVDGRQMVDGYGVHWEPIGRVARLYGGAQEFQGWNIAQLTQALSQGNPVVIWVYSSGGWPTSWTTPSGQTIAAYRDEHAVTAVGYVGPADNPSQLIINDPLIGQVYWQRAVFERKWNSFNRAGVVVY